MDPKKARKSKGLSRRAEDDEISRILTDISYQNETKSEEDLTGEYSFSQDNLDEEIEFEDLRNNASSRRDTGENVTKRKENARIHSIFETSGDWSILDISKNLLGLGALDRTILEASWKGEMHTLNEVIKTLKPESIKSKLNCKDSRGRTALMLASGFGHSQVVQFLVEKGVEVNVWDKHHKATPLICAAACASLPVMEILLKNGADVNAGIKDSKTALHWAVQSGNLVCIKILLEAGAAQNTYKKDIGTPLHMAAKLGDVLAMEQLLKHGANVALVEGGTFKTALHYAADEASISCVKLLLDAGASPEVKDIRGQTPLHLTANNSDNETTGFLLEHGANPNVTDKDGRTPLHRVVSAHGPRDSEMECNECILLLLEHKAEINWQDSFGYTALHLAAVNDSALCACLLLRSGSDVTLKTKAGVSALSLLVRRMPHVIRYIRETLDKAISVRSCDTNDPDCELKFDFRAIVSNNHNGTLAGPDPSPCDNNSSVKGKYDGDMQRETEFINCLISTGHKAYLSHPLIEAFILLKWARVRGFFWASLIFHGIMVILFTVLVLTVYVHSCPYGGKLGIVKLTRTRSSSTNSNSRPVNCSATDENGIRNYHRLRPEYCELVGPWHLLVVITWSLLVVFAILVSVKEILQMVQSPRDYIRSWEHWIQWILMAIVLLTAWPMDGFSAHCVEYWHYPSAAIGIFLAWSLMLVRIGRFPVFGSYIQMLGKVIRNFGLFTTAYSSLLLAFTFSFCVLFPDEAPFSSIPLVPLKVLTMMAGELNYDDLFYKDPELGRLDDEDNSVQRLLYPITSQIIYGCFVLVVTIVLMNLLVGLAVSDIQSLKKGAHLNRLSRQMASISQLESFLFSKGIITILPKSIGRCVRRRALLVPSSYKWTFYFRPNDPRDTRLPKKLQFDALRLTETRRFGKTVLTRKQTSRAGIRDPGFEKEFKKLEQKLDDHKMDLESILEDINNRLKAIQAENHLSK